MALRAPAAVTATTILYLPDGDGSANQVLKTDGSGNLGWSTSSSSSTAYWHQMAGGYKSSWSNSTTYYTYYRIGYDNWANGDSSPSSISSTDSYSAHFIAPRAGTITNVKVNGATSSSSYYADPFKFYFYKAAQPSDNSTSVSLTAMFNTSAITPSGSNTTWGHTEDFSSGNTFVEGDRIYVYIKKDSSSGSTITYFTMNFSGEY